MTATMVAPRITVADHDMSVAERLASLEADRRAEVVAHLTDDQARALRYDWKFWGRPDQLLPDDDLWNILLALGGRGTGKTRTGSEGVRRLARDQPGSWGALVAPTPKDARDLMIEGPSGILAVCAPEERPEWQPSLNRLTWPNGTIATVYSAADPEAIRGPNFHWAWCDELGKWRFMQRAWDNLRFSLRAGRHPQTIVTTTPTGHPLIRRLLAGAWEGTVLRRATTYRNAANLAPTFLAELLRMYEGTRLGLQELHGQVLDDIEGALWTMLSIEADRWAPTEEEPTFRRPMRRIVVAVDPSWGTKGDHCGIVVAGLGFDGRLYVLEDLSVRAKPAEWGVIVARAYDRWQADRIVAEVNFQAEQVRLVMDTVSSQLGRSYSFKELRASRGKMQRAEPVQGLYDQHRVVHVGVFPELEAQMTQWVPPGTINQAGEQVGSDFSPDRLDALVWAGTELMLDGAPAPATATRPDPSRRVPTGRAARSAPGLGRIPGVRGMAQRDDGLWLPAAA